MFPTQSKARRSASLWLLPVIALAMLLVAYAAFAYSSAEAQAPGDYCVEGLVINWEEKPLAGWVITLTSDISGTTALTTVSASDDDDDLDKGEFEFQDLPEEPGIYTATIESREGWEGVTPTTITFPINVSEDDCVRIRFKMRRIIPVEVIKFDRNHVGLEGWKIKVEPGEDNKFASPAEEETGVDGTAYFTLTPGAWIFTEYPPDDDKRSYHPVVPPSGIQELELEDRNYEDDELPIQVIFKNELVLGCIAVQKLGIIPEVNGGDAGLVTPGVITGTTGTVWSGEYGVPGWQMTLYRKDGSIADRGFTDATGRVEFNNLPFGPYTLVEENRAGWAERVDDTTPYERREQDVLVTGNHCDEDPPYVFENRQDLSGFCIEGYKVDANGGFGLADWEITIKPLDEGGFDPDDVTTDGRGYFRFDFPRNDYRIPGAEYEVCEETQDGWLAHTDTCQTVRLPKWPAGDCVELKDFVNQQVGHKPSGKDYDQGGGKWSPGSGSGSAACSSYHVVKGGEGLFDIGKMYNRSASQMLNANPDVKNNKHQWVYVGQKICIP